MEATIQLEHSLLRILLVGSKEEDFFLIREILDRNHCALPTELAHARSVEEAETMLQRGEYGLVLFEYDIVDAAATKLLFEFLHTQGPTPFIMLTENADEKAVADIIQGGAYDCMESSQLTGSQPGSNHPVCAQFALDAAGTSSGGPILRKLSCAVEHSADTILVTNSEGIIEHVNPAFEMVTGYSQQEIAGKNQNILKSELQAPLLYRELWETIRPGDIRRSIVVIEVFDINAEQLFRGTQTVLLVEDEYALRRAAVEFLGLRGYTVLEAKDRLDALPVIKNHTSTVHLVVIDVVMPQMSGGELATELERLHPETKLLFVSGYPGPTVLDH